MSTVGHVHPQDGQTEAECSKCPWTFKTTVAGKAAKELMNHDAEEHAS